MMKRSKQMPTVAAVILLAVTVLLVLVVGWHREMVSRYPVADLPFVNMKRLEKQIEQGNVGRTEALYYRKDYAGADSTEIR